MFHYRGTATRAIANHEQIKGSLERHFPDHQWVTFTPEIPVAEMLKLFTRANIIVGAHGAGLANLAFSPTGTRIIEFFPSNMPVMYAVMSKMVGHRHRCIAIHDESQLDTKQASLTVPIEAAVELVRDMTTHPQPHSLLCP